jgi:hypothetical protein
MGRHRKRAVDDLNIRFVNITVFLLIFTHTHTHNQASSQPTLIDKVQSAQDIGVKQLLAAEDKRDEVHVSFITFS